MRNDSSDIHDFEKWSRTYERSFLQNFYFDHIHRAALNLVAQRAESEFTTKDTRRGIRNLNTKAQRHEEAIPESGVTTTQRHEERSKSPEFATEETTATKSDGGNAPESILDVGCGTGRLLRKAGQRWPSARLVGVDPAQGMIDVARRLSPGTVFYTGSAEAIPLPDASVEVVLSTMSFHHWKDRAAGVREIARVLRPGGRFCLADATLPALVAKLLHHMQGNSFAAWRTIFEQAGLTVAGKGRRFLGNVILLLGVKDG